MERIVRRRWLLLSVIATLIALADGLAMMLPGPSNGLGGAALVVGGTVWVLFGLPRLATPAERPFVPAVLAQLGLMLTPLLVLPVAALWLVATPLAFGVWFGVAWLSVWLCCLVAVCVVECPVCREPFHRTALLPRIGSFTCVRCGVPVSPAREEAK